MCAVFSNSSWNEGDSLSMVLFWFYFYSRKIREKTTQLTNNYSLFEKIAIFVSKINFVMSAHSINLHSTTFTLHSNRALVFFVQIFDDRLNRVQKLITQRFITSIRYIFHVVLLRMRLYKQVYASIALNYRHMVERLTILFFSNSRELLTYYE